MLHLPTASKSPKIHNNQTQDCNSGKSKRTETSNAQLLSKVELKNQQFYSQIYLRLKLRKLKERFWGKMGDNIMCLDKFMKRFKFHGTQANLSQEIINRTINQQIEQKDLHKLSHSSKQNQGKIEKATKGQNCYQQAANTEGRKRPNDYQQLTTHVNNS